MPHPLRRAAAAAVRAAAAARRRAGGGAADPPYEVARCYAGRVPVRPAAKKGAVVAAGEKAAAAPVAPTAAAAAAARDAAAVASTWMFPWERRQMEGHGTGLRPWEKAYWGLFVTALAGLGFSRLWKPDPPPPPTGDEAREAAKLAAVRPLLAGAPAFVLEADDDPFDGDDPAAIEAFVARHSGAAAGGGDRFEGLEPAEIEALLAEYPEGGR